jgi:phosphohistidine phosphatase
LKRLYLLRHAKSSWDDDSLSDRDRPLAPRGRRAAKRLGRYLRDRSVAPEVVLCSPALRTRQTLELIEDGLGGEPELLIEDDLYGASAEAMLERLQRLRADAVSVLLIAHNPGVQELAVLLARGGKARERVRVHFPTAALAVLDANSDEWAELGPGSATLVDYVAPRELG